MSALGRAKQAELSVCQGHRPAPANVLSWAVNHHGTPIESETQSPWRAWTSVMYVSVILRGSSPFPAQICHGLAENCMTQASSICQSISSAEAPVVRIYRLPT